MQADLATRPLGAYFSTVTVLLLILSIVAFSDNLFTNVGQPSNKDPKFVIHGLFGLAWYVLLATQANLVRVRNVALHRRLGIATFIVAIGVTLSTLYIFIVVWKGWGNMSPEVRANRLMLLGYATCLWMAWQLRRQAALHKRLILVGSFFMLEPVLARAYDPLVASWAKVLFPSFFTEQADEIGFQLFLWGGWIGAFVSLAIYDLKTQKAAHLATASGFAWMSFALLVSVFT